MAKRGRKSKLTPERQKAIVEKIQAGNYAEVAAVSAGVTERTFYHWLERGEADVEYDKDTAFAHFFQVIKEARAEAETVLIARIAKAGNDPIGRHWQANAWLAERMYPDRWGRRERFEHTVKESKIEVQDVNDEAVHEAAEDFLRELGRVRSVGASGSSEPG